MTVRYDYESDLFKSAPEGSARGALLISDEICTIGISSSTNTMLVLKEYVNDEHIPFDSFLKAVFSAEQALFSHRFANVNVGLKTDHFTILPKVLSENEATENKLTNKDQLLSENAEIVYSYSQLLQDTLTNSFEHFNIYHLHSPVITTKPNLSSADMLVNINEHSVDVYAWKEGALLFCNSFAISSDKDVSYYTVLVAQNHLKIEPKEGEISITGRILENDNNHRSLLDFFKDVNIRDFDDTTLFRPDLDVKKHFFFHLLTLLNANN